MDIERIAVFGAGDAIDRRADRSQVMAAHPAVEVALADRAPVMAAGAGYNDAALADVELLVDPRVARGLLADQDHVEVLVAHDAALAATRIRVRRCRSRQGHQEGE